MKTVKEIVIEYCQSVGADGLCIPGECGCSLDDICLSESDYSNCIPAKKTYCKDCDDNNGCEIQREYECTECFLVFDEGE